MVDENHVAEMKNLVKIAKEKNKVVDANEALVKYPPEGTWSKDSNGTITVKDIKK